jgi:hypothetical protein
VRHASFPLLLAFVVTLPSLGIGFVLDDWAQRGLVRGDLTFADRFELFNFGAGDAAALAPMIHRGPFPWFTLPELKLRFLRPLASALIVFDTEVFGDVAWPQHLHSSLWYVLLTAVAFALYRRLTPSMAVIAAVLFALDDAHAMPVGWLANRNAIVAVMFSWLGLLAHLSWRERGWVPGAVVSALLYAIGLSAGESGVAALAYVVAYEVVTPQRSMKERARGIGPVLLVMVVYVVVYTLLNAGARGSGTYIDPVSEPLVFLKNAPVRFLANIGGQCFGLPDLWLVLPQGKGLLIAAGVFAIPVLDFAWRRWAPVEVHERRTCSWLLLGAGGSLLPTLATFPATRLFTAASLGLAPVVATLLRAAWQDRGARRWLGVVWLGGAFVVQPLTQWLVLPVALSTISSRTVEAMTHLDPKANERIVVLSSSEFAPAIYGVPVLSELRRPHPASWHVWSMAPLPVEVRRTGERQVELEVIGGRMIDSVFEQNFRSDSFPIAVGHKVVIDGETVTVLAVDGVKPTKIRVDLDFDVNDSAFVWWDGETLSRVRLPEVGQSRRFPRAQTVFERLVQGRDDPV